MALSEHVMRNIIAREPNINIAFALATDIPLDDDSVSLVTATEVLEHVPPIDRAIREIHRIMRPGGMLLCSIPNNFYHKYRIVGENPDHINKWTFDGFADYMAGHGFRVIDRYRIGYWVPIRYTRLSNLYLPITPRAEYYTSNFLYAFGLQE
jgi:ubiquinone/menaquinone biosynthesis C-methylase UbiE